MGGFMAITGQPDGEPTRVGTAVVDYVAGLYTTQGVLAALAERSVSGVGRHVEVALLDTVVAMLANLGMNYLVAGVEPSRFGNAHPSIAPYETLRVNDGEIAVAVGTNRQFARLAEAVGDLGLATDPRFATNVERVRNRPKLAARLELLLAEQSRAYWLATLVAADVPVAPVNTIPEVFADPVVRGRMVSSIDGAPQINSPVRLDHRPLPLFSRPPRLGEHTGTILAALSEFDRG
jgi:crotonobetainyl-CoA:carnitine CoA-transferase CaiB-like acyl-CoA transferase